MAVRHTKPNKLQKQQKVDIGDDRSQTSLNMRSPSPEPEDEDCEPTPRPLDVTAEPFPTSVTRPDKLLNLSKGERHHKKAKTNFSSFNRENESPLK